MGGLCFKVKPKMAPGTPSDFSPLKKRQKAKEANDDRTQTKMKNAEL